MEDAEVSVGIPFAELEACEKPPPAETKTYYLHHVNYRVKDPRVSVDFYSRVLGMRLLGEIPLPTVKSTVIFMGYLEEGETVPSSEQERKDFVLFKRKGKMPTIEFLHNWGTEKMPDLKMNNGNKPPKGYSHICLAVQDVEAEVKRVEGLGARIIKQAGGEGYVFLEDPDGYWIELLQGDQVGAEGDKNIDKKELDAAIGF